MNINLDIKEFNRLIGLLQSNNQGYSERMAKLDMVDLLLERAGA